jgi:hypothetical protein
VAVGPDPMNIYISVVSSRHPSVVADPVDAGRLSLRYARSHAMRASLICRGLNFARAAAP